MKIGILTYHYSHNFGAMIQAYALRTKVKELAGENVTVDLINFMPQTFRNVDEEIMDEKFMEMKEKREFFLSQHCGICGVPFTSIEQADEYDAYIVGSDQIWNPNLPVFEETNEYFLDFVPKEKIKIAYAASIGEKIDKNFNTKVFEEYLPKFDFLSMREQSYIPFIENASGKKCTAVLDPTFLIRKEYYYHLMADINVEENSILCIAYAMAAKRKLYDIVNRYAIQQDCSVVDMEKELSDYFFMNSEKSIRYAGIEEILKVISNSRIVFTDSYHYMVFSIIFHKPFYVMLSGKPSRIMDLLEYLQLENRIWKEGMKLSDIDEKIDYQKVDQLIEAKRESSIAFLNEALKDII